MKKNSSFSLTQLSEKAVAFLVEKQKPILIVFAAVVAFFLSMAGIAAWHQASMNRAYAALYKAGEDPKLLMDFAKSHGGKPAVQARLTLANQAMKAKDVKGCEEQLGWVYEHTDSAFYRVLALHNMAYCAKIGGDLKKSAEFYDRAAKENGNLAADHSHLLALRTRVQEQDKDLDELFKRMIDDKNLPDDLRQQVQEEYLWYLLQNNKR